MNIRKADAKGRLTGFRPWTEYRVTETDYGFEVRPVPSMDTYLDENSFSTPAPESVQEYLQDLGIDVNLMSREGINRYGYGSFVADEAGKRVRAFGAFEVVRKPWPEGFDWNRFVYLATGFEIESTEPA